MASSSILEDVLVLQQALDLLPSTGDEEGGANLTEFMCGEVPQRIDFTGLSDSFNFGANCKSPAAVLSCSA